MTSGNGLTKADMVRQAAAELGAGAGRAAIAEHVLAAHGVGVSDAYIYMVLERVKSSPYTHFKDKFTAILELSKEMRISLPTLQKLVETMQRLSISAEDLADVVAMIEQARGK